MPAILSHPPGLERVRARLIASAVMPSPIGHALAGYVVGASIAGSRRWMLLFAGLACLPDIDFLFGTHATYTHSIGAIAVVAAALALAVRPWTLVLAGTLAYASHPFLDWLGRDTSPPLGIMALWPFSTAHYMSPVPIIEPASRRYWLPNFWSHNLKVVTIEILVFGGLALAVHAWRRKPGITP
jgi:membrane-bound metal-dependent hydrolase YbcI (DUF457 family)